MRRILKFGLKFHNGSQKFEFITVGHETQKWEGKNFASLLLEEILGACQISPGRGIKLFE